MSHGLIQAIVSSPVFQAEWVLWLLFALSFASVAIIVERGLFYGRRAVDCRQLQPKLREALARGDFAGAAALVQADALECTVVASGLRQYERGPEAVEEILAAVETQERLRYSKRLSLLATIGSNAPFIGLFGTVLGIISAFRGLADDFARASGALMSGISEALVATAVGLLVAIPALVAYNAFSRLLKERAGNGTLLGKTLLAQLKSDALDTAEV